MDHLSQMYENAHTQTDSSDEGQNLFCQTRPIWRHKNTIIYKCLPSYEHMDTGKKSRRKKPFLKTGQKCCGNWTVCFCYAERMSRPSCFFQEIGYSGNP